MTSAGKFQPVMDRWMRLGVHRDAARKLAYSGINTPQTAQRVGILAICRMPGIGQKALWQIKRAVAGSTRLATLPPREDRTWAEGRA